MASSRSRPAYTRSRAPTATTSPFGRRGSRSNASPLRRVRYRPLEEFDGAAVGIEGVGDSDAVPGGARFLQSDRGRTIQSGRVQGASARGVHVADGEGDVAMSRIESTLYQHRAVRNHVLEQLEHAARGQFQIRGVNHRARNARQHFHLGAADHPAFRNHAAEHRAIEPNRAVQVVNRQSRMIEAVHRAGSFGSGRSRANTSSMVSRRLMSVPRLPETSTVAGRVRALKFEAAASWYAPVSRKAITSSISVRGASTS